MNAPVALVPVAWLTRRLKLCRFCCVPSAPTFLARSLGSTSFLSYARCTHGGLCSFFLTRRTRWRSRRTSSRRTWHGRITGVCRAGSTQQTQQNVASDDVLVEAVVAESAEPDSVTSDDISAEGVVPIGLPAIGFLGASMLWLPTPALGTHR